MIAVSYHSADGGLSLPFLQSFPGFLPAADLLWRQAQQPADLLPEEAAVAVVDGPIVGHDGHAWHLIALWRQQDHIKLTQRLSDNHSALDQLIKNNLSLKICAFTFVRMGYCLACLAIYLNTSVGSMLMQHD